MSQILLLVLDIFEIKSFLSAETKDEKRLKGLEEQYAVYYMADGNEACLVTVRGNLFWRIIQKVTRVQYYLFVATGHHKLGNNPQPATVGGIHDTTAVRLFDIKGAPVSRFLLQPDTDYKFVKSSVAKVSTTGGLKVKVDGKAHPPTAAHLHLPLTYLPDIVDVLVRKHNAAIAAAAAGAVEAAEAADS